MPGDAAEDALFRLVLTIPKLEYGATEAIEPVARLFYRGPDASIKIYHGAPPLPWSIEEIGGTRKMEGIVEQLCESTELPAAAPLESPFAKSGALDPVAGFDVAWFKEPELRLPVGRWTISVSSEISIGDCGGEPHRLTAAVDITVRP